MLQVRALTTSKVRVFKNVTKKTLGRQWAERFEFGAQERIW